MLNYSDQREPQAVGLALKIILELILAGTDVCVCGGKGVEQVMRCLGCAV